MPTVTFNMSPATAQRVAAAFNTKFPDDAPFDVPKFKKKVWEIVKSIVVEQEKHEALKAVPEPNDVPEDDGV